MSRSDSSLPGVSVIIRSYRRPEMMVSIARRVLEQNYPDFELIIVEQTPNLSADQRAAIEELAPDPRVHVLFTAPLGPAGARNRGCEAARKEIILFVDDDDTPLGNDWIRAHARHYMSPAIAGVSGREVYSPDERCGYRPKWLAKHWCLKYDLLGTPHVHCRLDVPIDPVDWLHGSNASVRRELVELVGGWDASFYDHEEHSFCWKLRDRLPARRQRLIFDPAPVILRTRDVGGGLERRKESVHAVFTRWRKYYAQVVCVHRPLRYYALYLVYLVMTIFYAVRFVWVDSKEHTSLMARLRETARTLLLWPLWYVQDRQRSAA